MSTVSGNESWAEYALYRSNREKGLRKEAFAHLDRFLDTTESWTFEEKTEFICFLILEEKSTAGSLRQEFPHPLQKRLLEPVLKEWCAKETKDSRPFHWFAKYCRGGYPFLYRALEIDPQDDAARATLLVWLTDELEFSVHHLPEYYIGEYEEDLKRIEAVKAHIGKLTSQKLRDFWQDELSYSENLIRNYADWKASGHPNLPEWGWENNRNVSSGIITSYYIAKK